MNHLPYRGQSAHPPAEQTAPFRARVTRWQLKSRCLLLPRRPRLMGIINVTPDSFSDGGQFLSHQAAIQHGLQLAAEGADLLDVGGESTRPFAEPVSAAEELRRVLPAVEALCTQTDVPVSIDTSKAAVAREALQAGAEIINDVTGLEGDPDMLSLVVAAAPGVCVMHMQGTPQTMQIAPTYHNVVQEVNDYLGQRRDLLVRAGLPRDRICLDPGIGFGKTHQHNLTLLAHCHDFHQLGCPLLVGASRKGFLAKIIGNTRSDRTHATVGASLALALQGVQILRVHDVAATRQALVAFEAVGGMDGTEFILT